VAIELNRSNHRPAAGRYGFGEQRSPGMEALGAVPLFTSVGRFQLGTVQLDLAF
jgi:hypothetical protein